MANIGETIRRLKEQGVFVYCADMDGVSLRKNNLTGPIALVLGSEGSGVSQLVKKLCDGVVSLDMTAQGTGVDSFNVSVAAGIILYEIQSQRAAQAELTRAERNKGGKIRMPKDDERKEMTQEEIDNGEEMTVTLTLDDGREIECVVLTIFPAGGKDYIALLPMDDIEAEDGEVYLYRYSETEDGTPVLDNIMDDDEYEIVADAFDEMLDDQEYDELVSEEDLDD